MELFSYSLSFKKTLNFVVRLETFAIFTDFPSFGNLESLVPETGKVSEVSQQFPSIFVSTAGFPKDTRKPFFLQTKIHGLNRIQYARLGH